MHDDSVLVAIDAALRSPAFCACGNNLTIAVHDDAAWLECASLARPSRLPSMIREMLHDRRRVIDLPETAGRSTDQAAAAPSRVLSPRAA